MLLYPLFHEKELDSEAIKMEVKKSAIIAFIIKLVQSNPIFLNKMELEKVLSGADLESQNFVDSMMDQFENEKDYARMITKENWNLVTKDFIQGITKKREFADIVTQGFYEVCDSIKNLELAKLELAEFFYIAAISPTHLQLCFPSGHSDTVTKQSWQGTV